MKFSLIICMSILIVSCSATKFVTDEYGASYKVRTGLIGNNIDEAHKKAVKHCAKFGKKSEFMAIDTLGQLDGTSYGKIAKFKCR
jgi:hypothetical protein